MGKNIAAGPCEVCEQTGKIHEFGSSFSCPQCRGEGHLTEGRVQDIAAEYERSLKVDPF